MSHRTYATDQSKLDHPARSKRSSQLQDAIATIIKEAPRGVHLTAPEVFRHARELGLDVSLSTVYRALNSLQAGGDVSTLAGDHGRRYEARTEDHDHDHIICLKCGLTIEFEDELIRGFGKSIAERKGYEHSSTRFDILGICADCSAKDEDYALATATSFCSAALTAAREAVAKLEDCLDLLDARKIQKAQEALATVMPTAQDTITEVENALSTLTQNRS